MDIYQYTIGVGIKVVQLYTSFDFSQNLRG